MANLKSSNDQLLNKNKKLEQTRDILIQKLESSSPSLPLLASVAPTPKPRTSISDRDRLERVIEQLRGENSQLQEDREKVGKQRSTVDVMFQDAQRKSQSLLEEKVQLEVAMSSLREQVSISQRRAELVELERTDWEEEIKRLRKEADTLKMKESTMDGEKRSLRQQMCDLEWQAREAREEQKELRRSREEAWQKVKKYHTEKAELEGKMLSYGNVGESLTETKSLKPGMTVAHRLNDALGKIRDLEMVRGWKEGGSDIMYMHEGLLSSEVRRCMMMNDFASDVRTYHHAELEQ